MDSEPKDPKRPARAAVHKPYSREFAIPHDRPPPRHWQEQHLNAERILATGDGQTALVTSENAPIFFEAYRALAESMGIPASERPDLYVERHGEINAEAITRKKGDLIRFLYPDEKDEAFMVIASATAEALTAEQLLSILAHELQHSRQQSRLNVTGEIINGLRGMAEQVEEGLADDETKRLLNAAKLITAPVRSGLDMVKAAQLRHHERDADQAAVRYMGGQIVADAFRAAERADDAQMGTPSPATPSKWTDRIKSRLHSTHPPMETRIQDAEQAGKHQRPLPTLPPKGGRTR